MGNPSSPNIERPSAAVEPLCGEVFSATVGQAVVITERTTKNIVQNEAHRAATRVTIPRTATGSVSSRLRLITLKTKKASRVPAQSMI